MAGDPAAGGQARSPEAVDRAMVAVCGAIWLVMLGMSVVATVALVQLGRGRDADPGGQSSWLLYSVIAVSALIIAGAIPLLLRARRTALADSGAGAESGSGASDSGPGAADPGPVLPIEAPTEKLRVFGTAVDPYAREAAPATVSRVPAAVVDRLWLRGTTSLLGAMGVSLADGNWPGLVLAGALGGLFWAKSWVEEGMLATQFVTYAAFRARVRRRLIPWVL